MQKKIFQRKADSTDNALWQHMDAELQRQEDHIELIASENYVSSEVLRAQGSVLTNKYAEGYPGKRYYGGCEHVDEVERLAIQRAQQLFNVPYANVQPHSGSQANMAAYMALTKPGDTILGMSLAEGGHLTHGASVNFSGKLYHAVAYGINPQSEILDFDEIRRLAHEHKPRLIICGASAYAPTIDFAKFRAIADEVKAYLVADVAHYAGLIAAGCYPSPVGHAHVITSTTHKTLRGPRGGLILSSLDFEKNLNSAIFPQTQGGPLMHIIAAKAVAFHEAMTPAFRKYQHQVVGNARVMVRVLTQDRGLRVVSGRTDCHMFLLDLRACKLTGKYAEEVLGQCHMTVNKNAVPNDPEKPFITSGIRIGTPAMTTRGFTEIEAEQVAHLIADVLESPNSKDCLLRTKEKVQQMCRRFPVYPA